MSQTLGELLSLWGRAEQVIQPITLPESKAIAAASKIAIGDNLKPPPPADLVVLRGKLYQAATSQDFSSLTPLDWRHSPFVLEGAGGLIETSNLLRRYLEVLTGRVRSRILHGLAALYIKTFNTTSQSTALLADFLLKHIAQMGPAWKKAQLNYRLFQRDQVVAQLSKLLVAQKGSSFQGIADVFHAVGLPSILACSQLTLCALQQALEAITQNYTRLSTEMEAKAIINLTSDGQGGLAWGGGSALVETMTDGLLLPFRSTVPPSEVRRLVEDHLLRQLKDPRLHPAKWLGVKLEAKEVIYRWLTEQSLELFLDIVDKVVNRSEDARRMWEMRGRFWRSYLNKGYIDEAWVVLGLDGVQQARSINSSVLGKNNKLLSYAQLKSSADVHKHVVLMMKIDSLTVVDWSHNGKCHIWNNSNPNAPKLYHPFYTRDQLVHLSEISFTHIANGSWTGDVAKIIYQHTGRRTFF